MVIGSCVLLATGIILAVVDVGTDTDLVAPYDRLMWPAHARKVGLYILAGVLGYVGLTSAGTLVTAAELSDFAEGTRLRASVGSGLLAQLATAGLMWRRRRSRRDGG